ncbi:hypothetical protein [Bradyrhizobium liaoningense]|uniref:hypothetical protein n=1 Tax=Bradyrhizobium liaoningense TaxID=43992 RepID=UPI0004B6892F|nr:hypothetical protein [Bradyrhizobium liaoningense]
MSIGVDLTITLSTIVETVVLGGGGIATIVTLRNTVRTLKEQMDASKKETREQFAGIQSELKKMGDILVGMARFDERLANLDKRVTAHGRQIDELRHGVGFVRGQRSSIDGEYSS